MATVKFFQRTTSKNKEKPVKIRVRLSYSRETVVYGDSLKTVDPKKWDSKNGKLNDKFGLPEELVELQQDLRELNNTILKEFEAETDKTKISSEWLNMVIDKHYNPDKYESPKITLFSHIENFIQRTELGKRKVCYRVEREYHITFNYLKEFAEEQGKMIDFDDIDLEFYEDFKAFLFSKDLALNTVGKKIKTLKVFLNDATERGFNTNLKYKSKKFVAPTEITEQVYLTEDELKMLAEFDLSDNLRLERIRDVFLVGCWTGLRFSDLGQVHPRNIKDGFLLVEPGKTIKSNGKVYLPIHPVVEKMLLKYDNNLPKSISNQKFNVYLKELLEFYMSEMEKKKLDKKAGLNELIFKTQTKGGIKRTVKYKKWELVRTHTARRSFASNAYRKGIPTITIMALTHHKTESEFLKYIRVTPKEHAEKVKNIWNEESQHLKVVS